MTASQVRPQQYPVARWAQSLSLSPLQKALAAAADPGILSLSLGLPDPALFPTNDFAAAAKRVLGENGNALQYSLPCEKLKERICENMLRRGVRCEPESVFLTIGAQQGLSLLARLLLDPGAAVIEEEFSYPAFQQVIEPYSPQVISVPSDSRTGIHVDILADMLARGPRPSLIYLMADAHNPLGVSIPLESRERLAEIARNFRTPIIEDDAYGCLLYEGGGLPPIRAFESDWVYYVGSFSKLLAPALRVGWIIVPPALTPALSIIKEASDLNISTFSQWLVADYLGTGALDSHIERLRAEYGLRRDAMNRALESHFPSNCRWRVPSAGVFFWIDLPDSVNTSELLTTAIEQERVAFLPSEGFSRGRRLNGMRLNFSRCTCGQIQEAVSRIGDVVKRCCR
jgi:2-aminoadipate transaminase